jgi:hypothetical protein
MDDKEWMETMDSPLTGARAALADCAGMLKALGYTLKEGSRSAAGDLEVWVRDDGTEVRLESINHNE